MRWKKVWNMVNLDKWSSSSRWIWAQTRRGRSNKMWSVRCRSFENKEIKMRLKYMWDNLNHSNDNISMLIINRKEVITNTILSNNNNIHNYNLHNNIKIGNSINIMKLTATLIILTITMITDNDHMTLMMIANGFLV